MEMISESLSSISLLWLIIATALLLILFPLCLGKFSEQNFENLPPGPPGIPIIGNLHQLGTLPHISLYKLSQKYGPAMHLKLGQVPALVVSSPEMAKEVLKVHDTKCCSRPDSYGMTKLSYNQKNISFSPYGDYWREMRKLCVVELFTVKRVRSFQHIRDQEIAKLVNVISKDALDPDSINIDKKIYSLAKNIICEVAFGTNYEGDKFKENEIQKTLVEAIKVVGGFCAADFIPYYGWIIDLLTGFRRKVDKCFHEFDKLYESIIQEHLEPSRPRLDHKDIADMLIALSNDETAGSLHLSKDHIKSVFMELFMASIDTSSGTIVWAMSELAKNPRVMRKVQSEIRNVVGNKAQVDESEIEEFKYFKMVVKETLRLHPPAPLLLPRESMQYCKIGGYNVYPKTRIFVNAWAIGRDSNTWWKPEEFYPERFEEDSEIDFKGQHYEFIPFGAGRRMCPGMTMGLASVESILANLLHCFDWELLGGMKPEDINMEEKVGLTINKKFPLHLVPIQHKFQTE